MCEIVPKELMLTSLMEENYIALQNFLSGISVDRGPRSGSHFSKTEKHRERKIYLLSLQDFKCMDCGIEFQEDSGRYPTATADHIIPYRCGSNLSYNCEFVCAPCNQNREIYRFEVIKRFFGEIYHAQ